MPVPPEGPLPKIMVVDDRTENLIVFKDILFGSGKHVLALPNGKMALIMIQVHPGVL